MADPKKSEFKVGDKVSYVQREETPADEAPEYVDGTLLIEAVKKGDGTKFEEGAWVYSVKTEDGKHSFDVAETDLSAAKGTEERPLRSGGKLYKIDKDGNTVEIESEAKAKPANIKTHVPPPKTGLLGEPKHELGGIEHPTRKTHGK